MSEEKIISMRRKMFWGVGGTGNSGGKGAIMGEGTGRFEDENKADHPRYRSYARNARREGEVEGAKRGKKGKWHQR